jgi:hypothetical protein
MRKKSTRIIGNSGGWRIAHTKEIPGVATLSFGSVPL